MTREATKITVKVLDLAEITSTALEYARENTDIKEGSTCRPDHQWGIVETPKGVFALCAEGVGSKHPVSEKNPLEISFYFACGKSFEILPRLSMKLKDFGEIPIEKEINLAEFIRSFGTRLEHNYKVWKHILEWERG
jgi:hypothetical protein